MDDDFGDDRDEAEGTGAPGHPDFSAHFTDPMYDDPGDEFAPFGSDEGADDLTEWSERLDELDDSTTVRFLLEDGFDDPTDVDGFITELTDEDESVDAAVITVGAGFTLLRLTGHIDEEGRALVLTALGRLQAFYGEQSQFTRMRADLEAFGSRMQR